MRAQSAFEAWTVFLVFLRLGLTSFGGPIAHLGYFRDEFVARRRWLSERNYADLVALCQFLPGPASSQVGMAVGLVRAGLPGALAAWAGFTLPSALALMAVAQGLASGGAGWPVGLLQGLKVVAVAVVAQAVWGMGRQLCTDTARVTLAAAAACAVLLWPMAGAQVGVMAVAAGIGMLWFKPQLQAPSESLALPLSPRMGGLFLLLFLILLVGLPLWARAWPSPALALIDAFYRVGSLVFGGGHVVLPLLQAEVVPRGWVDSETFLAGYGLAQAVPGPLFTFAAFLGTSMQAAPNGWLGGLLALVAIFVPSFLLVAGALPFWESWRRSMRAQAALAGLHAAVVGLLLAALYQPVWTHAIHAPQDFGLALLACVALMVWRWPPWLVVLASALAGWLLAVLLGAPA